MHPLAESIWRTSTRLVGTVRSTWTDEPIVVLTFDDGPVPGSTEELLGALAEYGASATFFVVMTRVRRAPHLLTAIIDEGHEVALHGPDHVRLTDLRSREVFRRTRAAKLELEDLAGRPVRWFRPPYGSQSIRTWAAVRRAGLVPVAWGGTTWDWKDIPTEQRLAKVKATMAPGQIVLAHDTIATTDDGAEPRVELDLDRGRFARQVLALYADHGFAAVSLGAALERGASLQSWAWFGR
jgi:peptidoglycan/xylan/chitin deacetylase (PgdA/CDA1 family)